MGYFSNGTEGMAYEEKYCRHCVHQEHGCEVWLLHMDWNYEAVGPNADTTKARALQLFIPRNKQTGNNEQCRMFHQSPNDEFPLLNRGAELTKLEQWNKGEALHLKS